MSASARYYECIEDTFEEVENRLEALESDPDVTVAEGVINVTFREPRGLCLFASASG
jgi:frataxin-like iron-binding protein CyaY